MLKYNYAYDESGRKISIKEVPEEGHLERNFICISCGMPMKACIGKERRYFRHEQENLSCSNESYIHKLAKEFIKERFDNSDKFEVEYFQSISCSKDTCKYEHSLCRGIREKTVINLKAIYDICTIEKTVIKNGSRYIADVLLERSDDPSVTPTFIEIFVHHECEEEKKQSGYPILELSVNDELEAENLATIPLFRETDEKISLYNFKRDVKRPLYIVDQESDLHKFAKKLIKERFESSESFEIDIIRNISCDNISCKFSGSKCHEITKKDIVDLKKKYDTCTTEKIVSRNGISYVADILLEKSDNPSVSPFLIEIYTPEMHECIEEKKNSGFSTLVLSIDDEKEARRYARIPFFSESDENISLYGFEKNIVRSLDNVINKTQEHILAQKIIKERFDNSEKFEIEYLQNISCPNTSCKYINSNCKDVQENGIVDLKKVYDSCSIEQGLTKNGNRYVADVLLYKSDNFNIKPVFIEIVVPQEFECKKNKENSGFPILELTVNNVREADELYRIPFFRERELDNSVYLYGFDREIKRPLDVSIVRYIHVVGEKPTMEQVPCTKSNMVLNENSDLEINVFAKEVYNKDDINDKWDKIVDYISFRFFIKDCGTCLYGSECFKPRSSTNEQPCFKRNINREFPFEIGEEYGFEIVKDNRNKRPQFNVAICATKDFINCELAEERFNCYLQNKLKECDVTLISGIASRSGGANGFIVVQHLSKIFGLPIIQKVANWERDGKSAAMIMNTQVLNESDALIYFWNGKDSDPQYKSIVGEANKRNIPCKVVNYGENNILCPICGKKMIYRNGKYSSFWGCTSYPDCKGKRVLKSKPISTKDNSNETAQYSSSKSSIREIMEKPSNIDIFNKWQEEKHD